MNTIKAEEHYKVEILVDDLFTKSIWDTIDEDTLNNKMFRGLLADAIVGGRVKLEQTTLCGTLEDFYPVD